MAYIPTLVQLGYETETQSPVTTTPSVFDMPIAPVEPTTIKPSAAIRKALADPRFHENKDIYLTQNSEGEVYGCAWGAAFYGATGSIVPNDVLPDAVKQMWPEIRQGADQFGLKGTSYSSYSLFHYVDKNHMYSHYSALVLANQLERAGL